MTNENEYTERRMIRALGAYTDNFDRVVANDLADLIVVDGEKDFTPERLRYYKDGTRRFLEYGTDSNFSEVSSGHLLSPDADQTLTLETAERSYYPVGNDLWPSMARRLSKAPQSGDVVGGGYGVIDLANFDPDAVSYSGTDADGFFWYHTADTGLSNVLLALVRGGTIEYSNTYSLPVAADILTIVEKRLNYYDVGPGVTRLTYTDIEDHPEDPQRNEFIGAVANDDGKGPERGSHRVTLAISQASGNTGLEAELGSIGLSTPGEAEPNYKDKGHSMDLEYTNPASTYEVCGALRSDPDRPTAKLRIPEINIIKTPGSSVSRTRVLMIAVGPSETDAPTGAKGGTLTTWQTPEEHNPVNSVVEEIEDNTLTGPDEADSGTDITGPTTTNSMDDPGGYQIGRDSVTPEGTGNAPAALGGAIGDRELYDTDVCLILVEGSTAGTVELDVTTEQNS